MQFFMNAISPNNTSLVDKNATYIYILRREIKDLKGHSEPTCASFIEMVPPGFLSSFARDMPYIITPFIKNV